MKIKYVHATTPDVEMVHDTEASLANTNLYLIVCVPSYMNKPSQEEYDKQILANFERDRKKGVVLSYEVLEEGNESVE